MRATSTLALVWLLAGSAAAQEENEGGNEGEGENEGENEGGNEGGTFEAEGSWMVGGASGSSSASWTAEEAPEWGESDDEIEIGPDGEPPGGWLEVEDEGPELRTLALAATGVGLAFVLLVWLFRRTRNHHAMARRSFIPDMGSRMWAGLDITAVSFALDARARPFVETTLADLSRSSVWTRSGTASRLKQTLEVLRSAEAAWVASAVRIDPTETVEGAQEDYREAVLRARTRERGVPETGKGRGDHRYVVATLLVAGRTGIEEPVRSSDADDVLARVRMLDELLPGAVAALEIVWSPPADVDEYSLANLRESFPEMTIDDPTGEPPTICEDCGAPRAAAVDQCARCAGHDGADETGDGEG